MKKVMMIVMMAAVVMMATAQGLPVKDDGSYEVKEVVLTDSVTAQELYERAMTALSEMANGNAERNMDYHDRDAATLVFKGVQALGFKNVFLGEGWQRYMNYQLKVRCKDGKAQVTVTVPKLTFIYTKNGNTREFTVAQMNAAVVASKGKKRERGEVILEAIKAYSDALMKAMRNALTKSGGAADDDDF